MTDRRLMPLLAAAVVAALLAVAVPSWAAWSRSAETTSSLSTPSSFTPIFQSAASLSGTVLGVTSLTADPGSWRSNVTTTYTYKWKVCLPTIVGCVIDESAFQASPTISLGVTSVAGTIVTLTVKATNVYGSTTADPVEVTL